MGYHINKIDKGVLGKFSKIREEVQELFDAEEQRNRVLVLCELADLIGAIEAFAVEEHNITLDELIEMKEMTKSAFEEGKRK
jgi:phosphoribosyl-ATP pyrophosphohydrolase